MLYRYHVHFSVNDKPATAVMALEHPLDTPEVIAEVQRYGCEHWGSDKVLVLNWQKLQPFNVPAGSQPLLNASSGLHGDVTR